MDTLVITTASYEKRKAKHEEYSRRIRHSLEEKERAREEGDLSENFGYVAATNEVENYRRMQADLGLKNNPLHIIDPKEWGRDPLAPCTSVQIGKVVEVSINNYKESLLIGGAWDADLQQDQIVPYTSPLAKCILSKKVGDTAKLSTNNAHVEILGISNPSDSLLLQLYSKKAKQTPPLEIQP